MWQKKTLWCLLLLVPIIAGCIDDSEPAATEKTDENDQGREEVAGSTGDLSDPSEPLTNDTEVLEGFPDCPATVRPEPRGYALMTNGPDGRVGLFTGLGGDHGSEFGPMVDQVYHYDEWVFDSATGCWSEQGRAPYLVWGLEYAYRSDTYVGYDWFLFEDDVPWLANVVNPVSEIWTKQRDGDWHHSFEPQIPARNGPAMAYHAETDKVVMFGGCALALVVCLDDTWVFDVGSGTWTLMEPTVAPPGRSFHQMEYDPGLDRIVLFGGYLGPVEDAYGDDTWLYDLETDEWSLFESTSSPPPRAYTQLAYASDPGRLYLFGGDLQGSGSVGDDLWYLDAANETWVEVLSEGPRRMRHAMMYDEAGGSLVVFGGAPDSSNQYLDETWLYDLASGEWHSPDLR